MTQRFRDSQMMRSANRDLRRLSTTFGDADRIAFFCECRSPICYSPIWLSAADFDANEEGDLGWLLIEGHAPSIPWAGGGAHKSPSTNRSGLRLADGDANPLRGGDVA